MEEKFCKGCIYTIKGGWKMYVEMQKMSNIKPRKGYITTNELSGIPMYYRKLPLETYIPGYVEVGEVCTGVFAGPREHRLAKIINKVIDEKCREKEYILIKTLKDMVTISFKVFVKQNG